MRLTKQIREGLRLLASNALAGSVYEDILGFPESLLNTGTPEAIEATQSAAKIYRALEWIRNLPE